MPANVKIVAVLAPKVGKADALEALLRGMLEPSRAEPGNLRYDLWQEASAGRFILDELYVDQAAVNSHRATGHFQSYLGKIEELAERLVLVGHPVDIG
ncbi:putative quinol monooxygenase [Novosphingobium sp. AP12]|uniref:putative quinol monooxygenase n=1 Tax=Novosphingobium sp. AP12 TaxID=1144305 RepID=UPI000271F6CA|nr:putative quinol monooxygenase [Novosphingobium sp. AP12]EJL21278.1 hypothetical protein PMI02_05079 [Novosphingobium sp. AP12]